MLVMCCKILIVHVAVNSRNGTWGKCERSFPNLAKVGRNASPLK